MCSHHHKTAYEIQVLIGAGKFSKVYAAVNSKTGERVALKVQELNERALQQLNIEVKVLLEAEMRDCDRICRLLDKGAIGHTHSFIALPLLGQNLHDYGEELSQNSNSKFGSRKVPLHIALDFAIQTLLAIEQLHTCGFLSRDIKAANFALDLATRRKVFIIDFGLAKEIEDGNLGMCIDKENIAIQPKIRIWRGTTRYGSLRCHRGLPLGRKDDLESWFYMVVQFVAGALPWSEEKDRAVVYEQKLKSRKQISRDISMQRLGKKLSNRPLKVRTRLCQCCPGLFELILETIDTTSWTDEPNYYYLQTVLQSMLQTVEKQ